MKHDRAHHFRRCSHCRPSFYAITSSTKSSRHCVHSIPRHEPCPQTLCTFSPIQTVHSKTSRHWPSAQPPPPGTAAAPQTQTRRAESSRLQRCGQRKRYIVCDSTRCRLLYSVWGRNKSAVCIWSSPSARQCPPEKARQCHRAGARTERMDGTAP